MNKMITCHTHKQVRGYIMCVHVKAGATVHHHILPNDRDGPEGLGELLCALGGNEHNLNDLFLACENCVQPFIPKGNS